MSNLCNWLLVVLGVLVMSLCSFSAVMGFIFDTILKEELSNMGGHQGNMTHNAATHHNHDHVGQAVLMASRIVGS